MLCWAGSDRVGEFGEIEAQKVCIASTAAWATAAEISLSPVGVGDNSASTSITAATGAETALMSPGIV